MDLNTLEVTQERFTGFKYLKRITTDPLNVDLNWLWANLRTQVYAFDDFSQGKLEAFLQLMADPSKIFLLIQESGMFFVQNAMEGLDAQVHFVVWDRNFSLHRDKDPAYELLDWLFYEVKVHRVSGYIPVYNKLAPRFCYAMGMRFEGELQEAVLWKQKYWNVQVFGLLENWYRKRRDRIQ